MIKKKYIKLCICSFIIVSAVCLVTTKVFKNNTNVYGSSNEVRKYTYNLPFKFSEIKETKFENKEFNIKNYGAEEGNNVSQNTEAFKKQLRHAQKAAAERL